VLINLVMAEQPNASGRRANQLGIEVTLEEPDPPVVVLGDRRQLTSAVYNLLEKRGEILAAEKQGQAASAEQKRRTSSWSSKTTA